MIHKRLVEDAREHIHRAVILNQEEADETVPKAIHAPITVKTHLQTRSENVIQEIDRGTVEGIKVTHTDTNYQPKTKSRKVRKKMSVM